MPRGSPFTRLCQAAAKAGRAVVADLHAHTTASDGDLTAGQLVLAAKAARLTAVAVTDHDTLAAVPDAVAVARSGGRPLEVVPGVEISADFGGREVHVLGLFVRPDDPDLIAALGEVQAGRTVRFRRLVEAIPELKPAVDAGLADAVLGGTACPGRRHVAGLLVRTGVAETYQQAFRQFVGPAVAATPPKVLIPVAEAARLVAAAGGVSALAHPPPDFDETALGKLRDLGVRAVEAHFPAAAPERTRDLVGWAGRLGLGVSGGSDCHSPAVPGRAVGSRGLTADELADLRPKTK